MRQDLRLHSTNPHILITCCPHLMALKGPGIPTAHPSLDPHRILEIGDKPSARVNTTLKGRIWNKIGMMDKASLHLPSILHRDRIIPEMLRAMMTISSICHISMPEMIICMQQTMNRLQ